MYLAIILGFCALTTSSVVAAGVPSQILFMNQETQPPADTAPAATPAGSTSPQQTQAPKKPEPSASQKKPATKKPKTKAKANPAKKQPPPENGSATSNPSPEKKVVRNGGATDPAVQLAPGVSPEQASNQRQNTTQLLGATDANLKQISSRQLNPTQQDSVSQIRKYMEQAKAAEQAGDVERAQNLASKALLLSDDLVKH